MATILQNNKDIINFSPYSFINEVGKDREIINFKIEELEIYRYDFENEREKYRKIRKNTEEQIINTNNSILEIYSGLEECAGQNKNINSYVRLITEKIKLESKRMELFRTLEDAKIKEKDLIELLEKIKNDINKLKEGDFINA